MVSSPHVILSCCLTLLVLQTDADTIKGPPQADEKEVKQVAHIGQSVRLVCPISGFPAPMIEWSKNGEKIDQYSWERHKASKKSLRIKNVNEDDTGVFACKGINGFGTETVRVELIVVDPRTLPDSLKDGDYDDVAPPVFTHDTKVSPRHHVRNVGDAFKVSCEALGSPQPEIFWFKDGQHIVENVHFQRGRSTVEFNVFGTADAGVYTCRARNLVGEQRTNFTLEVRESVTHAIVTEAGPANTTVAAGETATLQCRVKALSPPHIKWLKRLDADDLSTMTESTLKVGEERYRILDTNQEERTGKDEYLSRLVLARVAAADSGMYICFVTNSGFGALTYNSMTLRVLDNKSAVAKDADVPTVSTDGSGGSGDVEEPFSILVLVICLSILVFILLMVITVCVIRKRSKSNASASSADSAASEAQRPFMNNNKFNQPLPPMPHPAATVGHWGVGVGVGNRTVYPSEMLYKQQTLLLGGGGGGADSGCFDASLDSRKELDSSLNQYEVPYSHLQRQDHNLLLPYAAFQQFRSVPAGRSSVSGVSEAQQQQQQQQYLYPFRNFHRAPPSAAASSSHAQQQQQHKLYLNSDYDS